MQVEESSFYTCIPENISAYHTGSSFAQHYYECRGSFILRDIDRHKNFQSFNMQELFSIYQWTNVLHLKSIFGLRVFWFNFDLVYRYNAAIVAKSIVFVYFSFHIYGHLD